MNKALTTAALVATTGIIALGGALPANAAPCLPGFQPTKDQAGNNACMSRETKQIDPAGVSPDAPPSFKDPAAMRNPAAAAQATTGPGQNTVDVGRTNPAAPPAPAEGSPEAAKASAAAAAPKETAARLPSDNPAIDRTSDEAPIPLLIAIGIAILAAALGALAFLRKRKNDSGSPSEKTKPVAKEKPKMFAPKTEAAAPVEPVVPEEPAVPLTRRELKERNNTPE